MTIPVTSRADYIGNDTTDTYGFSFKIFAKAHLRLIAHNNADANAADIELVLDTDFLIDDAAVRNDDGGDITLIDANQDWISASGFLDDDWSLAIVRSVPLTQTTDLKNQGNFFARTHEDFFDKIMMIAIQQQLQLDRSLKLSLTTDVTGFDLSLPGNFEDNPGCAILINATANGLMYGPTAAQIEAAEGFAEDASDSADAAAISAAAALASQAAAATSATASATSATAAATSATNAATSASSASTSATASAASATAAAGSATTASTQATNAAASATTASTQATNAATSATAAAGSATTAAGSATTATTQATNAATSATNAAASAAAAAASAASVALATIYGRKNLVMQGAGSLTAADLSAVYALNMGGNPCIKTGVGAAYPPAIYNILTNNFLPAIGGFSSMFRLRFEVFTNHAAPAVDIFAFLAPITRPASAGGSGLNIFDIGASITSSDVTITNANAIADSIIRGSSTSGGFAQPADGDYVLAVQINGTLPANCHLGFRASLYQYYV